MRRGGTSGVFSRLVDDDDVFEAAARGREGKVEDEEGQGRER